MDRSLALIALVVRDYDEAIEFYTRRLGFVVLEDEALDEAGKRWVVIAPSTGGAGAALLLARAATPAQRRAVGDQTGGRVFLFLRTDDFPRDHARMRASGVRFLEEPREEAYGTVAVFEDLYGNRWDLLEARVSNAADRAEPAPVAGGVSVRPVAAADRAEWIRLLVGLYGGRADPDHAPGVDAFLAGAPHAELLPSAVLVAARPGGGLAGVLELSVRNYAEGCSGPVPHVESWYVDPDARGTGVGGALMEAACAWARRRGFSEIASDAEEANGESHRAHRALGFVEVERAVHFRRPL